MSNLKKEFKKRDVERMRNLIQGKYGSKTTTGIGYTKKHEHHELYIRFGTDYRVSKSEYFDFYYKLFDA